MFPEYFRLVFLAAVASVFPVWAATEVQMRTLMDTILNSTSYSSRVRPIADTGNVMKLTVDMYLIGLNGIDEVEQKMTSTAYLRVVWNDTFLVWTPTDHGDIDRIYIKQSRIWKPDLALANAFDSISGLGDEFIYMTVDYYGVITWQPYQVFESTCELDMTYFPFDRQSCDLEMVTWSSTRDMIEIVTGSDGFNIDGFEKNANWELLSVSTVDTSSATTSAMTFRMNIKRKPLYFLINFILPIVLLSVLNVFVFILPCDSGEKTGYAMVLFLSFAIFLLVVTDIMPEGMKTVPILSTYLLLMCVFSTIYVFIVIIELRLHNLGEDVPVPEYMQTFVRFVIAVKKRLFCKTSRTGGEEGSCDEDSSKRALDKKMNEMGGDEPVVLEKESIKMNKLSRRSSLVKDLLYNRKVAPTNVFNISQPEAVNHPYEDKIMSLEDADEDLFEDKTKNSDSAVATKHQNLMKGEVDDKEMEDEEPYWSDVTSAMDNFFFLFSIVLNGLTTLIAISVSLSGNN